jgi:hypothetical protein
MTDWFDFGIRLYHKGYSSCDNVENVRKNLWIKNPLCHII